MAIDSAKQKSDMIEAKKLKVTEHFVLGAGVETITAAGAVSVVLPVSYIESTGAIALTLANGEEGDVKTIIMVTDGGDATLTPANFANGATITFDSYDNWTGIFHAGNWYSIGTPTATVAG